MSFRWLVGASLVAGGVTLLGLTAPFESDDVVPFAYIPAPEFKPAFQPEDDPIAPPELDECDAASVDLIPSKGFPFSRKEVEVAVFLHASEGPGCALEEGPTVELVDASGNALKVDLHRRGDWTRLHLRERGRVKHGFYWQSWCKPHPRPEVEVRVTFSDGSTLQEAPEGGPIPTPPCRKPRRPFLGGSGPWLYQPPGPLPGPLAPLEARILALPKELVLDEPTFFVVELANTGAEPVDLEPCPAYSLGFGEEGTADFFESYLNCDDAPSQIASGQSLRFEMRFAARSGVFPDRFSGILYWEIHAIGDRPSASTGYIETVDES
jgi:hypothetical protein